MDLYWPITVKMSSKEYFSSANGPSYYDPEQSKKQLKAFGFCTNVFCFGRPEKNATGRHLVDGVIGLVYKATEDQSKNSCPNCTHALFWSRNYEYLTNKECNKRKIRTICEIYARIHSHSSTKTL